MRTGTAPRMLGSRWLTGAGLSKSAQPSPPASAQGRGPPDAEADQRFGFAHSGPFWQQKQHPHLHAHACTPLLNHGSRHPQCAWTRLERTARSRERTSSVNLRHDCPRYYCRGRSLGATAHRDSSAHCDRIHAVAWNRRPRSRGPSSGHSHWVHSSHGGYEPKDNGSCRPERSAGLEESPGALRRLRTSHRRPYDLCMLWQIWSRSVLALRAVPGL